MKTLLSICSLVLLFNVSLKAQILEKEANMSLGVQTASQMDLDDINPDDAFKLWKSYFKDFGKIKRNKKADEYYSTGVKINRIYNISNIDVYTRFEERGNSTTMTLWVDLGMAFVNSKDYPSEYKGVVELMDEFRVQAKEYVVQKELDEAVKKLESFEDNLDKLEKANLKLHEKIADYNDKIIEAQEDIELNRESQYQTKIDMDRQLDVMKEIQERLKSVRRGDF